MRRYALAALFVLIISITVGSDAWGCPTCKDGLQAADSEGANIARGYFYSILLMIAMPFTLAGSFGLYVWREMRRQQHAEGSNAVNIVVPVTGCLVFPIGSPGSSHENHVPSVST
jgi:heme/copper-type cytochrome/quinol oxidase subunit 2